MNGKQLGKFSSVENGPKRICKSHKVEGVLWRGYYFYSPGTRIVAVTDEVMLSYRQRVTLARALLTYLGTVTWHIVRQYVTRQIRRVDTPDQPATRRRPTCFGERILKLQRPAGQTDRTKRCRTTLIALRRVYSTLTMLAIQCPISRLSLGRPAAAAAAAYDNQQRTQPLKPIHTARHDPARRSTL